ncbi:hypothetical protein HRI96_05620 [Treponema parvum]|uniref:GGDEF domain-containing protein n=1 Tax=Treponema parvum TaxID=138851 RepID=A0A975EZN5_9SPIR|nr:hypothetical protein [Treponema parvum]QTQ11723.1 hypothetical protein HRI96_05620 [Treponema parvum]QTQ16332.1 hypothetical protein HXT04_06305 [Treponema parvum]
MKSKKIGIVSGVISVIFLLTVANLIVSTVKDYRKGIKDSSENFLSLSKKTSDIISETPVLSEKFIPYFVNEVSKAANLFSVRLEYNGKMLYEFPPNQTGADSPLVKTFTTHIEAPEGTIVLTETLYLLTPYSIFDNARIAFFIILLGTLITAIMLLYVYLSEKAPEAAGMEANNLNASDDTAGGAFDLGMEDFTIGDDYPQESEGAEGIENGEAAAESLEEYNTDESFDAENKGTEAACDESTSAEDTGTGELSNATETAEKAGEKTGDEKIIESEWIDDVPVDTPQLDREQPANTAPHKDEELFSPLTGFCREAYLKIRLEDELVRAASVEQDLSFLIIRIPGLELSDERIKKVVPVIKEYFSFVDMIFEFGDDGFAVIRPAINLDTALGIAENFHGELITVLRSEGLNMMPAIGISARSLRLISCDRLIAESEQAAEHALNDANSPIVAFRVDPEKYRKFLAQN